jgi:hypothetical protein
MSINSVSFFQQDQNYWQQARAQSQASSAGAALINVMGQAMTNLAKGKASIANGEALKRTNSALTAAIQSILQSSSSTSGSSSASSSTGSSSSGTSGSSASTQTAAAPAVGIGTARLTTATSLFTLGILQNGTVSVTTGSATTTYTSTGDDTVGDLINALNINIPTNAHVIASLNSKDQLVLTGRNTSDFLEVGGTGTDATALGFGVGNNTFQPTKATSSATNSSSSASSSTASTSSSSSTSSKSTSKSASTPANSAPALQTFSTAASILSASGASGNLVDMLA